MTKMTGLFLLGLLAVGCTAPKQEKTMSPIENIMTRTSVRQFTGEKISQEQIDTLLRCAMAAPSAINKQPWAFVVVTDSALLAKIGAGMPNTRCQNHPACAFVPCGDLTKAIPDLPDFWINDVSAATENLLLAAHAMGLGGVWTGVHPSADRVKQVQALLGLPEHIIPLCIVPIGVPAENPTPKDKYQAEIVHYNQW